jgi:hypothetical protein
VADASSSASMAAADGVVVVVAGASVEEEARRRHKAAASSLKTKVQYSLVMVCSRQRADPGLTVCGNVGYRRQRNQKHGLIFVNKHGSGKECVPMTFP